MPAGTVAACKDGNQGRAGTIYSIAAAAQLAGLCTIIECVFVQLWNGYRMGKYTKRILSVF